MRIVVCANNWVGYEILVWLKEQGAEIVGLVIHPTESQKFSDRILAAAKLPENNIFYGNMLDNPTTLAAIQKLCPDIAISVYFGYIFRKSFINLFTKGCINLHPAYLPYNRGAYPNVWSIVDGTPAGVTLHYIDEGIDSGDIIAQKEVEVLPVDTGESLYRRLESASIDLFHETWPRICCGEICCQPQRGGEGTFHCIHDTDQLDAINPNQVYTAEKLINILRARTFPPHKGAYLLAGAKKIYLSLKLEEESEQESSSE